MQTKELEIPKELRLPEWQTNKVKIRKWSLAIRNEILDQTTEFTTQGGVRPTRGTSQLNAKVQGGYSQILTIVKCVTEAPWKVGDTSTVGELDPELGDWLYGEISDFNSGGSKNPPDLVESSKEK